MAILDPTGVFLTPGNNGADCLGNGQHLNEYGEEIECCCDNCDYYLCCNTPNNNPNCFACDDANCPRGMAKKAAAKMEPPIYDGIIPPPADTLVAKQKGDLVMGRAFCGFLKGMLMGVLVGGALGAMGACYMRRNRRGVKRNVGHALRTVGDLTDSILGMF